MLPSVAAMPALFEKLVGQPAGQPVPVKEAIRYEVNIASGRSSSMSEMDSIGRRSALACPECHGVMWEINEGDLVRYRCHVGHAYSAELMSLALDDNLRRALGGALRALEERVALAKKLESEDRLNGRTRLASSWAGKVREYEAETQIVREAIRRTDEIAARLTE